ncbi:MFS transporter [Sneathiella sp. HT1-7]|uniref:MFS transporter n=1 Tax=Sneathiella sp. HT1-7 TaxID=2887192 RepID=UPI001D13D659|nr:MFS transporter [Sneathiella sp. HT1-7]MCC3304710.1 MFS transporter [Sneathiella sp. HT1-7]
MTDAALVDNRRALIAVIAAVTAMAVSLSLSIPLVSLLMEKRGYGSDVIGLMGAMPALSFLLASPAVPACTRVVGSGKMLWGALLISAVSIWALSLSDNIYFWFFLRLMIGLSMAILFLISETWLNKIAREKTRGRTIAIYVSSMTCGFAFGPVLINFLGAEGSLPFIVASLIVLSAGFAFLIVGDRFPDLGEKSSYSIFSFIKIAPMISAATILVAFFDGSVLTLLPVYGVKNGQVLGIAVLMTSALLAGNILLQVPIGWLADRFDRTLVILICGIVGVLGALILPLVILTPYLLWPLLIVWGGGVVGTYTIALVIMGQQFKGGDLVTATAAVGMLWGLGSLLGPVLAGVAMEIIKPHGMPLTFAAACLLFVLVAANHLRRSRKA